LGEAAGLVLFLQPFQTNTEMNSSVGITQAISAHFGQEIGGEKMYSLPIAIASRQIADSIERINTIARGEKRSAQENRTRIDYPFSVGKSDTNSGNNVPIRAKSIRRSTGDFHKVMLPTFQSTRDFHKVMLPTFRYTGDFHKVMLPTFQSTGDFHKVMLPTFRSTGGFHKVMLPIFRSTGGFHKAVLPFRRSRSIFCTKENSYQTISAQTPHKGNDRRRLLFHILFKLYIKKQD
jgi:hypothetical protein